MIASERYTHALLPHYPHPGGEGGGVEEGGEEEGEVRCIGGEHHPTSDIWPPHGGGEGGRGGGVKKEE